MSSSAVFRANPGLIVAIALCVIIPLVLLLMTVIMRVAGASLRPVIFMAGLMLPLVFVFLVGSLVRAREPANGTETSFGLPISEGHIVDRTYHYGVEIPDSQMRDAKSVFPEFFAEAEVAELAIVGTGESILAAQFPTAEAASRATKFLWQTFQIQNTSGDEKRGWRGKRGQNGDYIELLQRGRHLFFWTGLTKDAAAARRAASNLANMASQIEVRSLFPRLTVLGDLFQSTGVKMLGLLFMVALYTVCFFKGAAWSASSPAAPGVAAVPAGELASRLEAINSLEVPFHIERGEKPNELFATWRYADAKWVDLARAHGLRRTFRIRLVLDESGHTVRSTDYVSGYDWSAGSGGARLEWKATVGLILFQTEQSRVFGVQLDEHGKFKPELSYAYKFNLNEMKTPLVTATTKAGWTWRPTVWQGPVWLRWLTE